MRCQHREDHSPVFVRSPPASIPLSPACNSSNISLCTTPLPMTSNPCSTRLFGSSFVTMVHWGRSVPIPRPSRMIDLYFRHGQSKLWTTWAVLWTRRSPFWSTLKYFYFDAKYHHCWSNTCIAQGNACIQLTCCCVVVLVVTN